MSEQLSVCEGAGYDKVFQSGHKPKEGFSQSSEKETSAYSYSLDNGVESYGGESEEEREEGDEGGEEREDDWDEGEVDGRAFGEGSSRSPRDGHIRPFILPKMWTVNDFKPMMTTNIFKNLRDYY